jgi:hypothetical protein
MFPVAKREVASDRLHQQSSEDQKRLRLRHRDDRADAEQRVKHVEPEHDSGSRQSARFFSDVRPIDHRSGEQGDACSEEPYRLG